MSGKPSPSSAVDDQSLGEAFKEAFTHPSYLLLVSGFFVCGFQVAFYGVHLPRFVADQGLDAGVGVWALATVGLANLVGTFIAGQSGRFVEKRRGLSLIYFGRCFIFLGLLFLPITGVTVIVLSAHPRPVVALHGAAHLQPGRHLLRHPLDVDAVRGGVPVAPGGVVRGADAGRHPLRCHRVL